MIYLCKTPFKKCSIEADRFGAAGPGNATSEVLTARGEDGIFFHGLGLHGCCEGHQFLHHTRVPDLYQVAGPKGSPFGGALDGRWLPYAAVGGYSAGRQPFARYLARHKDTVKYAFLLDPSYRDNRDYSASIRSWILGSSDRRLLAIFGTASTPAIVTEWIGGLRGCTEEVRKHQIVVWHTGEGHFDMKKHIGAMENPSYQPPGRTLDKDFAASFS